MLRHDSVTHCLAHLSNLVGLGCLTFAALKVRWVHTQPRLLKHLVSFNTTLLRSFPTLSSDVINVSPGYANCD